MKFENRSHAGDLLATKLESYRGVGVVVLGLSRGGVPVAVRVAHALDLPIDVLVVKKISSPYQQELGIGALAPDGVMYIDWKLAQRSGADEDYINSSVSRLDATVRQKMLEYRKGKKPLEVTGKTVIVVDDGAATGATLEAAIRWLKKKKAKKIIVALPVCPVETAKKIKPEVESLVVLEEAKNFSAVGQFYGSFEQVREEEIVKALSGS